MEIGKIQDLKIVEKDDNYWKLEDENKEYVMLSKVFFTSDKNIDDLLRVFIYQDQDNLPKPTTEIPNAQIQEYAVMECVETLPVGAFMDWGIIKDLFIPYKEQKEPIVVGKKYLVYVYWDSLTERITGTTKIRRNLNPETMEINEKQKVDLIIHNESELGWNVIISNKYQGLVYYSDVYKKLYPLSSEVGYIKTIRPDLKIDVSLQPIGYEGIDEHIAKVLEALEYNSGELYLSDSSDPEDIKTELAMSKKNFKKAIGTLYRENKIIILDDKIRLTSQIGKD